MTKETHSQPPMANHTTVSIPELRAVLNGRVISPEDAAYDTVRAVFYGARSRRPALIVRVADATDVSHVVSLARERGLELAVRSGGHSLAGHSTTDGGIVLDLSEMKGLEIDLPRRTAWAETGLTAGEYTAAAGAPRPATGIGGITLGGGVGFLVRKYGLTIDDLLAAEIVTAEGELLYVDAESHPDLFWAIRGGGGNFGVATRFKFRLHEVDTIVGGMLILPATSEVISSFVAEAEAAPDELSTIANVMVAPPMPFLPAEAHGRLVIMALLCYAGEVDEGERAIAPFAVAQIRVLGGAMTRVSADATAFTHRERGIMVALGAVYERPEETAIHEEWVGKFAAALRQGDGGVYVNFLGDEGEARIREAYPGATFERLAEIKGRYDSTNLFRLNQNIPPETGGRAGRDAAS